jgi:diguanylate cyclase (GGDEF)-like protein
LAICAAVVTSLVLARQVLAQRDLLSAQGELSHQAMHDALTGLPNRVLVLDRADQMLARARRQRLPVAALYVDIDGFKHVNDTFGHAAGDELLKTVAGRLAGVVRGSDTVGRMGGDEFVVLLDSPTLDVAPELIAERMLEVLREPIELQTASARPITVSASMGIAVAMTEGADELLANADMALYKAKANGKDRTAVFESSMQTAAQDRLLLEMDLRAAVDDHQFFLMYQPTFDLRSETVTGVEALLRWRHPSRGVTAPDLFIPIAEETGIIVPIGQWVLHEACHQAAIWRADGHPVGMSVNVSARQLDDDRELVAHVQTALADSGLDPSALTLEITETALMHDPDQAADRLTALKALGVRIAIDDFGTGYSSMAYLRRFPVDALKIDRSFISGIAVSTGSREIVHSLVQLGKTLGLETLGEGIEEPTQLRNLQREQCDSGQGFLFARPLEPHEIPGFIERSSGARVGTR